MTLHEDRVMCDRGGSHTEGPVTGLAPPRGCICSCHRGEPQCVRCGVAKEHHLPEDGDTYCDGYLEDRRPQVPPRSDGIAKLALDIVDELLGAPPVTVAGQVRRKEHLDYIVSKLRAHLAPAPGVVEAGDVDALVHEIYLVRKHCDEVVARLCKHYQGKAEETSE